MTGLLQVADPHFATEQAAVVEALAGRLRHPYRGDRKRFGADLALVHHGNDRWWTAQGGTALSNRIREGQPNAVSLLLWGHGACDGRCRVERWGYGAEPGPAFVRAAITENTPDMAPR